MKRHIQSIHENKANFEGQLKIHRESVHGNVRYSCGRCEYKAKLKDYLKRHIESIYENVINVNIKRKRMWI